MKNFELLLGDCAEHLSQFEPDSIDLIYLDPPFFTQKTHKLVNRDRTKEFSFTDLWASHVEYADFLHVRLQALHRVLSQKGSLFFHCDRNASHIIRSLLDDVFGANQFRSEIVWHYRRWSNKQKGLLPAHQIIYYYTKSNQFTFNPIFTSYSESTNVDQILQKRQRDQHGKSTYARDAAGNILSNGGKKGVPLSDVWDIPYLNPKARERTGYPTQKPLLLLEQILKIASNEGDLVLDPFCGSGTTVVAAKLLNRRAIGIDISNEAITLSQKRLEAPIKTESALLKKGRESYKGADEAALAMLTGLDFSAVQRNKGIDAILKDSLHGTPIPIRVQRPHETIIEAGQSLYRAAKTKNAQIMFLVTVQGGGFFPFANQLPAKVRIVEAPALIIKNLLEQIRESEATNSHSNLTELSAETRHG